MSNNYPDVNQIFDDLDAYRDWCRYEGKRFDERDLYNGRSDLWHQYQRYLHYRRKKLGKA